MSLAKLTNEATPPNLTNAVRRNGTAVGASAVAAVLAAACGVAPYVIVYLLARELLESESTDGQGISGSKLATLAAAAAAALVGRAVFSAGSTYLAHLAAYRILGDIRVMLASKLGRMPLGDVADRSVGELKKTTQEDVEQLEEGIAHAIPDLTAAITVPLVTATILFVVDWRMALLTIASVPLAVIAFGVFAARGLPEMPAFNAATTALNSSVLSYLQGMKVVRGFVRGSRLSDQVTDGVRAMRDSRLRLADVQPTPNAFFNVAIYANVALLVPCGAYFFASGSLSGADFVLFMVLGLGFAVPIQRLIMTSAASLVRVSESAKAVNAILTAADLPIAAQPHSPANYDIVVNEVSFGYTADVDVLSSVNLTIPAGSSLALVGPSGAGKTTIARLIARFWDVGSGSVTIGGVDVREIAPDELSRIVALVAQDEYLFNDSVLENIRMGRPDATDDEVRAAARSARVDEFVATLEYGWDTKVGSGGARLSGGQRQRISIARALLKAAPIVILDEATAFLDAENELALREAIAELGQGRTLITIAHRIASVTDADAIAVVAAGTIDDAGTHTELLGRCDLYQRLWSSYHQADGWSLSAPAPADASATSIHPAPTLPDSDENTSPSDDFDSLTEGTTERLQGKTFAEQWLTLVGPRRPELFRKAVPLLLIDGMLRGAPIIVVFLALRDLLNEEITPARAGWYAVGLVVLLGARVLVNAGAYRALWKISAHTIARIQATLLHRLRQVPLGSLTQNDTGRISNLLTGDANGMDFVGVPVLVTSALLAPPISAVVLLFLDWRLALLVLAGVPLFGVALWWGDRRFAELAESVAADRASATAALIEHIRGTAVLRAYPGSARAERYRQAVDQLRVSSTRASVHLVPSTALGAIALELGTVALIAVGSALYSTGSVSATTLILFLVLTLVFYQPIESLHDFGNLRHIQQTSIRRISTVWDAPILVQPEVSAPTTGTDITFDAVTFDYHSNTDDPTLSGVNFTVPQGTITALVGPSGSGKSTITNLVARFWDVDGGQVRIGGTDIRDLTEDDLMSTVTAVYQDVYLFNDTVAANVAIGRPDATHEQIAAALEVARCDFVDTLPDGVDTVLTDGGANLSGGQRQRLSIARALLKDSPVLLLDEAVASVDPETEAQIQHGLAKLAAERTVLVVAHRLNTVTGVEQIVVIADGRVDGAGTHEQLLRDSPVYQRLWRAHECSADLQPTTVEVVSQ